MLHQRVEVLSSRKLLVTGCNQLRDCIMHVGAPAENMYAVQYVHKDVLIKASSCISSAGLLSVDLSVVNASEIVFFALQILNI